MRLALFLATAAFAFAGEPGFKPLFNGRSLAGWIEDTPGIWSVRDGMIVGRHKDLQYNDFLRTKREYSNFVLKLSFRLVGGEGNSGVQIRSKPVPGSHEVAGYQADISSRHCWGCLYDEARRRKFLADATPASRAALRPDGWNEMIITAQGSRVTVDLNGVRAAEYEETDPAIEPRGILALQVHGGLPVEVHFKDLLIRESR
jgi:hypothetical protein